MSEQNQNPEDPQVNLTDQEAGPAVGAGPGEPDAQGPTDPFADATPDELKEYIGKLHEALEAEQAKSSRLQVKALYYARQAAQNEEALVDARIDAGELKVKGE